jgi:hypothetical protein
MNNDILKGSYFRICQSRQEKSHSRLMSLTQIQIRQIWANLEQQGNLKILHSQFLALAMFQNKIWGKVKDPHQLSVSHTNYMANCIIISVTGKGKVVPVLFFTEYHTIKAHWGSESIAPHSLDLSTRWGWVVSFMPQPLYPQEKSPWYPMDRRLGGSQSWSGHRV